MVLGLSSFTYGWGVGVPGFVPPQPLDPIGLLEKTVQLGLRCLQLGDNAPVHRLDEQEKDTLRRRAQEHNLRLELGARGMTLPHLELYIGLAVYFGSPLIRFVIDEEGYTPGAEEVLEILREAKPALEQYNIVLGIENHDRFRSRELAAIVQQAGSHRIGICLDCANSIGTGEGLEHVAAVLGPHTVNLHIKDFTITRLWHKMGFKVEGVPFGTGLLDLDFLLNELSRHNRCQSAILEQWVPPDNNPHHTVLKEDSWAEEGLAQLRKMPYFS